MASRQDTVDRIVAQATGPLQVSARKMFGEYALYAEGKLVALICDDRLFVKPTEPGRALLGDVEEAPPYPGAKPSLVIGPEWIEDGERLGELVRITAEALPAPSPRRRKTADRRG